MKTTLRPSRTPSPRRCSSAFSLVELLASLAVIAILATLVTLSIGAAQQQSLAAQSTNNLRQLATANLAYASEHGHYAPHSSENNNIRWCGARPSSTAPFDPAKGYLAPYLGRSGKVGRCPLFDRMPKSRASFEQGTGGYGYNAQYIGGRPTWETFDPGDGILAYKPASPGQIERLSSTLMFATCAYAQADGLQEYSSADPPFWDFGYGPSGWRPSPTVHFRFDGKALVGWCDGHVTAEVEEDRPDGYNPHEGDAASHRLGWYGPDEQNGYWNPQRSTAR